MFNMDYINTPILFVFSIDENQKIQAIRNVILLKQPITFNSNNNDIDIHISETYDSELNTIDFLDIPSDKYIIAFRKNKTDFGEVFITTIDKSEFIKHENIFKITNIEHYQDIIDNIPEATSTLTFNTNEPSQENIDRLYNIISNLNNSIEKSNNLIGGSVKTVENVLSIFKTTIKNFIMIPYILKLSSLNSNIDINKSFKDLNIYTDNVNNEYISYSDFFKDFVDFTYIKIDKSLIIDDNINKFLQKMQNDFTYDVSNYNNLSKVKSVNQYVFHLHNFSNIVNSKYNNDMIKQKLFINSMFYFVEYLSDKFELMKDYITYFSFQKNNHISAILDSVISEQNINNIVVMLKLNNFDHDESSYNKRFQINLDDNNNSLLLKYNTDNYDYYTKQDNKFIVSEYIKTFYDSQYPSKYSTFVDNNMKNKFDDLKSSGEYQIDVKKYDKEYLYGDFHKIYPPSMSNKDIVDSKEMDIIINRLLLGKPVFVIGYGSSGAGKTSSLVYFSKGVVNRTIDNKNGILIHICNKLGELGYNKLLLSSKEYFRSNNNDADKPTSQCKIIDSNNEYINYLCESSDETEFTYNNKWQTNNPITSKIHNYRLNGDESNDNMLGEQLIYLIDKDRFVKATTNNPNSSRSHVMVYLKFSKDSQNPDSDAYLFLGDFAGVENKFNCNSTNVLTQFINIEKNEGETYYGQPQHGGEFHDSVFVDTPKIDDNLTDNEKMFDWFNPIPTSKMIKILPNINSDNLSYIIRRYFPIKLVYDYKLDLSTVDQSQKRKKYKGFTNHNIKYIYSFDSFKSTDDIIDFFKTSKNSTIDHVEFLSSILTDINDSSKHTSIIKKCINKLYFNNHKLIASSIDDSKTEEYTVDSMFDEDSINRILNGQGDFYIPFTNDPNKFNQISLIRKKNPSGKTFNLSNEYHHNNMIAKTGFDILKDIVNIYFFTFVRYDARKNNFLLYNENKTNLVIGSLLMQQIIKHISEDYLDNMHHLFNNLTFVYDSMINKLDYAKEICTNRSIEGEYINHSLELIRNTINTIVQYKNKNVIFNSPSFLNECLYKYCKKGEYCFHNNKLINNIDIVSPIFKDVYEYLEKYNKYTSFESFFDEVIIVMFGVFNISRIANNPPPVPYIDINELKYNYFNTNNYEHIYNLFVKTLDVIHTYQTNSVVVNNWKGYISQLQKSKEDIRTKINTIIKQYPYDKYVSAFKTFFNYVDSIKHLHVNLLTLKLDLDKINAKYKEKQNFNDVLNKLLVLKTDKNKNIIQLNTKELKDSVKLLLEYNDNIYKIIPSLRKDVQTIEKLVSDARKYLYDSQPNRINVQMNIDMKLLDNILGRKQEFENSSSAKDYKSFITFIESGNKGAQILKLIETIDNNNAISSVGTLEFLDKISKFNVPNNICYLDDKFDYKTLTKEYKNIY